MIRAESQMGSAIDLGLCHGKCWKAPYSEATGRSSLSTASLLRSLLFRMYINFLFPRSVVKPEFVSDSVPTNTPYLGSPTYALAKYLTRLLDPLVAKCIHHVKNSVQFVKILDDIRLHPGDWLVSFDVISLFTKLPLLDTLEYCVLILLKKWLIKQALIVFHHV